MQYQHITRRYHTYRQPTGLFACSLLIACASMIVLVCVRAAAARAYHRVSYQVQSRLMYMSMHTRPSISANVNSGVGGVSCRMLHC